MHLTSGILYLSASDLSNHPGCGLLTQLNRKAAAGDLKKPFRTDPSLEVLQQRGREHEAAFVEHLRNQKLTVVNIQNQPAAATIAAMVAGTDVIVQARLEDGPWMGYADVLIKMAGNSKFGNWAYEVYDTKLSLNTKAATVLQLCLYTDLLTIMQGSEPEKMYVVKPESNFKPEEFRYSDFKAYYRLVKRNLTSIIAGPVLDLYPVPVPHCDLCNWWPVCDKKRHDDDYLSLVAGIQTLQIEELQKQNIPTLEAFANATVIEKPVRGHLESFIRRQNQAKVQLDGRLKNQMVHQVLPAEDRRGFNRMPEPNAGDIYFDIEGDAFYPGGGLEYLLGYAYRHNGVLEYKFHWAKTRSEEREAFRLFMEFVVSRLKRFPQLHIYHFAPYEPTAVKRLASSHAVFEPEVDELLRAEKFTDLHALFKEALLASVERYSLKDLEKFTAYVREADLREAGYARKTVECALELRDFKSLTNESMTIVEIYNEDDCLATEALHGWLEQLRESQLKDGKQFTRPSPKPSEPNEKINKLEEHSRNLFKALTVGIPENPEVRSEEEKAKWLLAHQLEYFRREDKSAWWEYFRVHKLEHEELFAERTAVTGLQFLTLLEKKPRDKNYVHRYEFPPQEIGLSEGDTMMVVNSQSETEGIGKNLGTVVAVSLENNTIDIKQSGMDHPSSAHANKRITPDPLWESLMRFTEAVIEHGLTQRWPYSASKDLLMRRSPRLLNGVTGAYVQEGEDTADAAVRIALTLDKSILPIQGPPGTGKTHTGAKMIIALVKAGKKVGVTAISHKVIFTLYEKVRELCGDEFPVAFVHKGDEDNVPAWIVQVKDAAKITDAMNSGKIVGGTAWLWSSDAMDNALDYLFIDEAGQMSLSQALSASRAAKNLILLGDPQQLEQPQKGAHPEGSDVAALTYLLEGSQTMPEGKGLFLGVTRRIHPAIAAFTSELFYEGRLKSYPGLENQVITGGTPFDGAGLFHVPVLHSGDQNSSAEEVDAVGCIVSQLLALGSWTNAKNESRKLTAEDILIVAPYNAQVGALIAQLPGLQVGTVDKFQGREAPVVIYSMTASSVQDAPRGMQFLFSPNRLNVATSRAKSVCILVASPRLMEPECHTIDQMKWANALCRYLEMSSRVNQ